MDGLEGRLERILEVVEAEKLKETTSIEDGEKQVFMDTQMARLTRYVHIGSRVPDLLKASSC